MVNLNIILTEIMLSISQQKQRLRLLKQQRFAAQIVELTEELEFAKNRERELLDAKEQERQRILGDRLKPKGVKLFRK